MLACLRGFSAENLNSLMFIWFVSYVLCLLIKTRCSNKFFSYWNSNTLWIFKVPSVSQIKSNTTNWTVNWKELSRLVRHWGYVQIKVFKIEGIEWHQGYEWVNFIFISIQATTFLFDVNPQILQSEHNERIVNRNWFMCALICLFYYMLIPQPFIN